MSVASTKGHIFISIQLLHTFPVTTNQKSLPRCIHLTSHSTSLLTFFYVFLDIVALVPIWNIRVRVVVFNATFNNISVISWQSVVLVEETRVPGENKRPVASHWQTLSHNVDMSTPSLSGIRIQNFSGNRHRFLSWICRYVWTLNKQPVINYRNLFVLVIIIHVNVYRVNINYYQASYELSVMTRC